MTASYRRPTTWALERSEKEELACSDAPARPPRRGPGAEAEGGDVLRLVCGCSSEWLYPPGTLPLCSTGGAAWFLREGPAGYPQCGPDTPAMHTIGDPIRSDLCEY